MPSPRKRQCKNSHDQSESRGNIIFIADNDLFVNPITERRRIETTFRQQQHVAARVKKADKSKVDFIIKKLSNDSLIISSGNKIFRFGKAETSEI